MTYTPMSAEARRVLAELARARDSIKSRDDLIAFIQMLIDAVERGALDRVKTFKYIDGLSNSMFDIDGWCANHDEPIPERLDWRWMGRSLAAAFY